MNLPLDGKECLGQACFNILFLRAAGTHTFQLTEAAQPTQGRRHFAESQPQPLSLPRRVSQVIECSPLNSAYLS